MTGGMTPLLPGHWPGAELAQRQMALRGRCALAAVGLALLGMTLVEVASHTALHHAAGPAAAALLIMAALPRRPLPTRADAPATIVPPPPIDPATMATFIPAFVIGRTRADRLKR